MTMLDEVRVKVRRVGWLQRGFEANDSARRRVGASGEDGLGQIPRGLGQTGAEDGGLV